MSFYVTLPSNSSADHFPDITCFENPCFIFVERECLSSEAIRTAANFAGDTIAGKDAE